MVSVQSVRQSSCWSRVYDEVYLQRVLCAAGGDAQIKVIGVGGGGGNAINRMIASGLQVGYFVSWYRLIIILL